jgi:glycosyltransferase involved in cell wall biosynthesis
VVTVLTTMPSYPYGKIFKGYRGRVFMKEEIEGIKVVRIWSIPASNKGKFRRIISHLSFGVIAPVAAIFLKRNDLVIARVPNIGTDFAGIVISRLKKSRLLLELEDIIPDNLLLIGVSMKSIIARALYSYYRYIFRNSDLIAVIGPCPREVLVQRGVSPERILLWPNAADKVKYIVPFDKQLHEKSGFNDKFIVVYAGSFSSYYDVPNIIAAAALLQQRLPIVRFMLTGAGPDWEKVYSAIRENNLINVTLPGIVPYQEIHLYLQTADLFLTSLVGKQIPPSYIGHLSAKICEYLMVGRPVISIESAPVCGEFLKEIGAGFSVPANNPGILADAIEHFVTNRNEAIFCGINAKAYAKTHLDRDDVTKKFYAELISKMKMKNESSYFQP